MARTGWGAALAALMVIVTLPVAASTAGAAEPQVVINEIHYHPPVDGREFLELHNPGDGPVDLSGACFTAGVGGCFPAGTALPAGGFVVVVESPADYAAGFPGAPAPALTYTGSLSNSGERVTLSQGATVLDTVAYTDTTPWPLTPDGSGPSLELTDPLADNDTHEPWAASIPAPTPGAPNSQLGAGPVTPSMGVVINEIHYHPPVEEEEFLELHNPGSTPLDLTGACFTQGIGGCFAPGTTLAAGGFVVVAQHPADYAAGFPGAPAPALAYTGALSNSGERITLAQGSTVLDTVEYSDSAPWPTSPDGYGPSLELVDPLADNDTHEAWDVSDPAPTPGATNTRFGLGPLPVIDDVTVGTVAANAPVRVTADVTGAASVTLEVVVGFGTPQAIPMRDDGASGDGAAGDGRYGATIGGQPADTLVRYRVLATNGEGTATVPPAGDPRPRLGFVVAPSPSPTPLPVIQWFTSPEDYQRLLANRFTNDYVPAVIAVGREVWDGAEVRVQGNVRFTPKLSFKFKMPRGFDLVAPDIVPEPVDEFVLDNDRADSTGFIPVLGFDVYGDTSPYAPQAAKVRVHRNGSFVGLYTFLEEFESNWMERAGLDHPGSEVFEPEGVDGVFIDEGSPDALVPRFDRLNSGNSYANLYALTQAIDGPPTPERSQRLRDLFDVPALVEFLAVGAILQHWDQTVHNFVVVRDGETGRWRFAPDDLDNTLGLPLRSATTHSRVDGVYPFGPDNLVSALRGDAEFNEMYFRRLRTLADTYLAGGELQRRADALAPLVAADFAADRDMWGHPYTLAQGRAQLRAYLDARRHELLSTRRRAGEVPPAPTAGRRVVVSELAYAATGGPDHDWVELHNPSATEAVDLSGWTLRGAGDAVLPGGTVLPAGGFLVVPGDQAATDPARPSGTLVAGSLDDGLADGGGTLEVVDTAGTVRARATYATTPPWPTAPAAGQATLELVDPRTDGTGPGSWRASTSPAGSPGSSGNPAGPPPADRLAIEASADQAEARPGDGAGVAFTIAVTNTGTAPRPSVTVTGPGTTCDRSLGTLAPGASHTFRCRSRGSVSKDRTYLFAAASGSVRANAPAVPVRTLVHATQYYELGLPTVPRAPQATVPAGGRVRLTWQRPPTTSTPHRWTVITGHGPGRAAPTDGWLRPPASAADIDDLPLGEPVQLAVALRSRSGTGARTAPTPVLTPRPRGNFPYATNDDLIRGFYLDLEGRAPGEHEYTWWRAAFAGGVPASAVVTDRLAQGQWSRLHLPVIRLYVAYFRRLPDQAGLAYWVDQLRGGRHINWVSAAFAATPEFRTTYGTLDDVGFIDLVYRNVLGRAPDATGLWHWVSRLQQGMSRGRLMLEFSESPEGRGLLAPMAQTALVWTAMLGTTPSAAEAQPAVDWLAEGGALVTVVEGVRTSDRYAAHVG